MGRRAIEKSEPKSKTTTLNPKQGQAQWEDAPSRDQGLSHNLSKPTDSLRENTMVAKVSLLKVGILLSRTLNTKP
jgi:hypothetical protein